MTKQKTKLKKTTPPTALQMLIRELAANWPEEDTNLVAVRCTGIERAIPPESQHEDAIKAREYCAQARKFGETGKGALFLQKAQAALKDFELLDAAVTGEPFLKNSGRKKGSLSKKTKYINQLANAHPELCPKELYRIADKSILGEGKPMQISTFGKKVSEARNPKQQ